MVRTWIRTWEWSGRGEEELDKHPRRAVVIGWLRKGSKREAEKSISLGCPASEFEYFQPRRNKEVETYLGKKVVSLLF